ncbi:uncharacterized protein LOC126292312 [Schistocerca gregaria]|uniref:uncharacterized protein LOC126292312 n=1 Tax=Schistocerca gregaria TaxID=7010 RepID=UPI00211DB5E8|nr:uncharacterized protein LOC126292312 [Schistocerca gregaria]
MSTKCGSCRRKIESGVVCGGCGGVFHWGSCSGKFDEIMLLALPWNCRFCSIEKRIVQQEEKMCALQAELDSVKTELAKLKGEKDCGKWELVTRKLRKGTSHVDVVAVPVMSKISLLPEVGREEPKTGVVESRVQQTTKIGNSIRSGKSSNRKRKVLLLGSSHGRGVGQLVQEKLGADYQVTSLFKPSARLSQVIEDIGPLCRDFDKNDEVIVIGGAGNSLAKDRNYDIKSDLDKIGAATGCTNVGFVEVLQRYDQPSVNPSVWRVNRELSEQLLDGAKTHIYTVPVGSIGRWGYTRHALHLNSLGKDRLADLIVGRLKGATSTQGKTPVTRKGIGAPFFRLNKMSRQAALKGKKINGSNKGRGNNCVNIFHQNIRGLRKKIDELIICFENIKNTTEVDVLCLFEHHITTQMENVNINGYKLATYFCRDNMEKGGAAIYVKGEHSFKNIETAKFCVEQHIEVCACELKLDSDKFIIVTVYRSPLGNFQMFLKNLDLLLRYLSEKGKHIHLWRF